MSFSVQPLRSQWWWHMSKASSTPHHPPNSQPSLCLPFFSLSCSGLHLSLNGQSRTGSCLGPELQREKQGGEERGGAQILMRCAVSMATLAEEGKKKRVLSLSLHSPLLCAPSSSSFSILPSSPAGEGLCKTPDDTPDAPTQQPLLATFTSLP